MLGMSSGETCSVDETCSVIYSLPLLLTGTKSLTLHAGSFTEFPAFAMYLGSKQLPLNCFHTCYPPNTLRHHDTRSAPSCASPVSGRGSALSGSCAPMRKSRAFGNATQPTSCITDGPAGVSFGVSRPFCAPLQVKNDTF